MIIIEDCYTYDTISDTIITIEYDKSSYDNIINSVREYSIKNPKLFLLTKLLFNSEGVYFKQEFFMKNGYLNKKFLNFVKSYECNIDIDLPVDITEFDFNKKIWEHTHKIFNLTYTLYDNMTKVMKEVI